MIFDFDQIPPFHFRLRQSAKKTQITLATVAPRVLWFDELRSYFSIMVAVAAPLRHSLQAELECP